MTYWGITKVVPQPRLVCVELNPGPPKVSEMKRERIMGFLEAGGTPAEAAEQYERSKSTITRLQAKVEETGSVKNRPGQGRKRKLSPCQADKVRKKAKRGKDSPQIAQEISHELKEPVSVKTIQRTIKSGKLEYLVVEAEEEITDEHKSKRLAYAQENLEKDWKLVGLVTKNFFNFHVGLINLGKIHRIERRRRNRKDTL